MDHPGPPWGNPPAAKSVIRSLPSVIIAEEDLANGHALCAVCRDEISLKEKAKRLPCSHHFHGDCIFPWLAIRNSCPVCRHELPTDDPEYENWKAQRSSPAGATTEEPVASVREVYKFHGLLKLHV
ncbi:RING [Musa troglodytarum]|uniref:RING-type E3 ubiquitin transferase n=1 Tax=Musa troglodytarum TaxID=320322 RepID=A0A9E7KRB9_9LILI|nr:RING [Musa troglodytarum]